MGTHLCLIAVDSCAGGPSALRPLSERGALDRQRERTHANCGVASCSSRHKVSPGFEFRGGIPWRILSCVRVVGDLVSGLEGTLYGECLLESLRRPRSLCVCSLSLRRTRSSWKRTGSCEDMNLSSFTKQVARASGVPLATGGVRRHVSEPPQTRARRAGERRHRTRAASRVGASESSLA